MVRNLCAMQFNPWARKIPWRRQWLPTPVFLPGEPMDRGAWWATVQGVTKSWTRLSNWHFSFLSGSNIPSLLFPSNPCQQWFLFMFGFPRWALYHPWRNGDRTFSYQYKNQPKYSIQLNCSLSLNAGTVFPWEHRGLSVLLWCSQRHHY